ncbi:MAG: acyl-CoA dehydrogenase family protein [Desulfobacterales bacterium]|nr:acyl-CoA dehydrogenase family protein [Desulfobacterales bacterium]
MDFSLNENQLTYLDTVRKFVKNEITPHILEMEKEPYFSVGHYQQGMGNRAYQFMHSGIRQRL